VSDRVSSTNTQGDATNRAASQAGLSAAERREWNAMNDSNARVAAGQGRPEDGR
jgi:hypothetical protein